MVIPPFHPIVVHFPAAMIPASFACDAASRVTGRASLRAAGWWMLFLGVAATPVAAATGWYWLRGLGDEAGDPTMVWHKWLGTAVCAVLLALLAWRWRSHARDAAPGAAYLAACAVVVGVVGVQGHIGGMMRFGDDDAAPAATVTTPATAPAAAGEGAAGVSVVAGEVTIEMKGEVSGVGPGAAKGAGK